MDRAKKCMDELGMKDLLQNTGNWDKVSFGDIGNVKGDDLLDESVECDKDKANVSKESSIPEESEFNAKECKVVSNLDLMESKLLMMNSSSRLHICAKKNLIKKRQKHYSNV